MKAKKKIGLFAAGSTGDIYPMISLGKILSKTNDVTIITYQNFYYMVKNSKLKFMKLGENIYENISNGNELADNEKFQSLNYSINKLQYTIDEMYKKIDENENLLKFDLIVISNLSNFICPDLEKRKIPYIILSPILDKTSNIFSPPMLGLKALEWNNFFEKFILKILWFIYNLFINYFIYKMTNKRFKKLNIKYKNYRNDNSIPRIYTFSKHLIDIGSDTNTLQVGYLNYPNQFDNEIPEELEKFFNEPEYKYIYIGFGSMM